MAEQDAFAQAVRFAPALRFHTQERHLPASPDDFRRSSRFRKSRTRQSDEGWERGVGWNPSDSEDARFYDIPWASIAGQSLKRYGPGPFLPHPERTLRPRNSFFSGVDGLFLERRAASIHDSSGNPASGRRVRAPLFIDVAHLASYDPPLVKLLYWFFYELNWWYGIYTHQGDWEHVTWIWTADEFKTAGRPRWAYFAQHVWGKVVDFEKLQFVGAAREHPRAFVDRNGHPTADVAFRPARYSVVWETWRDPMEWVPHSDWRDFAGAWGEVGLRPDTTGPLGPLFKRNGDKIRVKRRDGKVAVKFSLLR